jgi:hypothetical protein
MLGFNRYFGGRAKDAKNTEENHLSLSPPQRSASEIYQHHTLPFLYQFSFFESGKVSKGSSAKSMDAALAKGW